jgi:hypothetical protein
MFRAMGFPMAPKPIKPARMDSTLELLGFLVDNPSSPGYFQAPFLQIASIANELKPICLV